jgi:glycosyltransferase involved in cell wall biosynthesis
MLLSIVIPTFNEELTIGSLIDRTKETLNELNFIHEIIVVDDCSSDRSVEIAWRKGVKVYSLRKHMGKGYALRAGFAKAKGEIIATLDSDGSHRPEELPRLLAPILKDRADLVIGSRFSTNRCGPGKRFNAAGVRIFNVLVKILTGASVSDSQSGYRVMNSKVLVHLNLKSEEYEIESEMLVKIARRKFRIKEVPISFEQRTYVISRLDPVTDGFKILLSIIISFLKG